MLIVATIIAPLDNDQLNDLVGALYKKRLGAQYDNYGSIPFDDKTSWWQHMMDTVEPPAESETC